MTWSPSAQAHLAARLPYAPRWLLWLDIKDFAGDPFSAGFWTGDDHEFISVESESRLYYGAQGGLSIPPIRYVAGTRIGQISVSMAITPEAETILRGYQTRFGGVEIHCALFDPSNWSLLDVRRFFRGFIDGSPIYTPPVGGVASATLNCVSSARRGTRTTGLRKSHSSQKRRSDDQFREYGSLGRVAADWWGERDE